MSTTTELPAQRHSETSMAAARGAEKIAPTQRQLVHSVIALAGTRGLTDEEMQAATEMNPSTQRPRRVELVTAGVVVDSGRVRPTTSGRNATVWVAVQADTDSTN